MGLKPVVRSRSAHHTAVWDGNKVLVSYRESGKPSSGAAWRSPQWLWRNGLSLSKVYEMIKRTAKDFSSFAIFHPFLNLSEKLKKSFSSQGILPSAASFFDSSRIDSKLVNEIVRAESRYRLCSRSGPSQIALFLACSTLDYRCRDFPRESAAPKPDADDSWGARPSKPSCVSNYCRSSKAMKNPCCIQRRSGRSTTLNVLSRVRHYHAHCSLRFQCYRH